MNTLLPEHTLKTASQAVETGFLVHSPSGVSAFSFGFTSTIFIFRNSRQRANISLCLCAPTAVGPGQGISHMFLNLLHLREQFPQGCYWEHLKLSPIRRPFPGYSLLERGGAQETALLPWWPRVMDFAASVIPVMAWPCFKICRKTSAINK